MYFFNDLVSPFIVAESKWDDEQRASLSWVVFTRISDLERMRCGHGIGWESLDDDHDHDHDHDHDNAGAATTAAATTATARIAQGFGLNGFL